MPAGTPATAVVAAATATASSPPPPTSRLVRQVRAASREPPVDPAARLDPTEAARLRNARWLPPLAERARDITAIATVPRSRSRRPKEKRTLAETEPAPATSRGSHAVGHGELPVVAIKAVATRFPAQELRDAHQWAKCLKSNERRRFVCEIREAAMAEVRAAQAVLARERDLRAAQLDGGGAGIAWGAVRPLSREPTFARLFAAMAGRGRSARLEYHPSLSVDPGVTQQHSDVLGIPTEPAVPHKRPVSAIASASSQPPPPPIPSDSARTSSPTSLAADSASLVDLRHATDSNVFARVARAHRTAEESQSLYSHAFGRPAFLKDGELEECNSTFRHLAGVGDQVTATLVASQVDKRRFSAGKNQSGLSSDVAAAASLKDSTKGDKVDDRGRTSTPASHNNANREERNPISICSQRFQATQAAAAAQLTAAVETRRRDRKAACTTTGDAAATSVHALVLFPALAPQHANATGG
ncbi:hypothetical protein HK405_010480, partial [Cladochytrium tenue]